MGLSQTIAETGRRERDIMHKDILTRRVAAARADAAVLWANRQLLSRRQIDCKGSNIRKNHRERPCTHLDAVSSAFTCCGYRFSSYAKCGFG